MVPRLLFASTNASGIAKASARLMPTAIIAPAIERKLSRRKSRRVLLTKQSVRSSQDSRCLGVSDIQRHPAPTSAPRLKEGVSVLTVRTPEHSYPPTAAG